MIPLLVLDVLVTDGGYMELELIADEVRRLRPDARPDSIRRAVYRLQARGALESRRRIEDAKKPQEARTAFRIATEDPWQHVPIRKARL